MKKFYKGIGFGVAANFFATKNFAMKDNDGFLAVDSLQRQFHAVLIGTMFMFVATHQKDTGLLGLGIGIAATAIARSFLEVTSEDVSAPVPSYI